MRFYVDTNVWRDLLESRDDGLKPLGEFAHQFLKQAILSGDKILYSDLVVEELMAVYSGKEIEKYCLESIRDVNLLEKVVITNGQFGQAVEVARQRGVPRGDALHAILARDAKAIVITRDKHFEALQDVVESRKPEEVT